MKHIETSLLLPQGQLPVPESFQPAHIEEVFLCPVLPCFLPFLLVEGLENEAPLLLALGRDLGVPTTFLCSFADVLKPSRQCMNGIQTGPIAAYLS